MRLDPTITTGVITLWRSCVAMGTLWRSRGGVNSDIQKKVSFDVIFLSVCCVRKGLLDIFGNASLKFLSCRRQTAGKTR
jgi:hypothetical protein